MTDLLGPVLMGSRAVLVPQDSMTIETLIPPMT